MAAVSPPPPTINVYNSTISATRRQLTVAASAQHRGNSELPELDLTNNNATGQADVRAAGGTTN